jgi:hypothetical protein
MNAYRNQLTELLARTDQIAAEAKSHVDEPDHEEPDERVRAAKVLVEMVELREGVEGKLRGGG